jgi:hypothetical protein
MTEQVFRQRKISEDSHDEDFNSEEPKRSFFS